jgi:hypothetical protein
LGKDYEEIKNFIKGRGRNLKVKEIIYCLEKIKEDP